MENQSRSRTSLISPVVFKCVSMGFAVEIELPASLALLSAAQMRIHAHPNIDPAAQTHARAPRIMPWYFQHTNEDFKMNKNQIKGKAKDIAGKVQEAVGKATGNTHQQVKGLKRQAEGKLEKAVGDVKEAIKKI